MQRYLVVSPHPDDLDFGCAGTVAKLAKEGNDIEYLIVSDGSKGSQLVGFGGKKLAAIRETEQKDAANTVGVQKVTFLGEVDGEIENTRELRKKLVKEIRKAKPDIVLSFDPSSLQFESVYRSHRDHRQVAEATFDAIYPAVGNASFFPELLEEGIEPHQIEEIWFFATPRPNKFIDIADTIDLKIKALLCHKCQHEDVDELEKRIRSRSREEGKEHNMEYAEGFRAIDFKHY